MTEMTAAQAEAHLAQTGALIESSIALDRPIYAEGRVEIRGCTFVATPEYREVLERQERESGRRWEDMGWEEFKAYMRRWGDEVDT